MIVNVNAYNCSCSCCPGSGCTLSYLGSVSVPSCFNTTCPNACSAAYPTCSIGSINAVCNATNIFYFYSILFLIIGSFIFILSNKF